MIRTLLACVVLCIAAAAYGQTFDDTLAPGLSRNDYKAIVDRLDLTKEQHAAADQLFQAYTTEHTREAAEYKAAFDRLGKAMHFNKETGETTFDPGSQEAWDQAALKYNRFKPKAKAQIISDTKSLLTEAQAAEKWPGAARFVRRMLLGDVRFSSPVDWVRADISRCLDDLKVAPETLTKVRPLQEEYELRIDKPLQRMEHDWVQGTDEARRTFRDAEREVAALNRRYLRVIAQELPAADSAALTTAAKARAYWLLYQHNGKLIHEGFAKAKKLPSFTQDQQKKADALLAEIDKAVAQYRKDATPDYDAAAEKVERMSQKEYDEAMTGDDNPFIKLSEKWKWSDMWVGWVDRMMATLTDEQRHELWPPTGDPLNGLR